jgi:3-oxoacyl-[acyl-carrier-protein] synthase-3
MTLGIEKITYYLPQQSISDEELAATFSFDLDFIRNKLGIRRIFVAGEREYSSDLAAQALLRLFEELPGTRERIQVLVVCTQTPDFQLPHVSAIVQDKAGLGRDVAAFDISLGCSGFVYGLSLIQGFMEQNKLTCGILVTAETYSKIIDSEDRNTKCLFSDAAAATLIGPQGRLLPMRYTFGTGGHLFESLIVKSDGKNPHGPGGSLHMDGRAIFEFVADAVPNDVRKCLRINGLTLSDIDFFVFHQASNFLLNALAKELGIVDTARVVKCVDQFANTVSSQVRFSGRLYDDRKKVRIFDGGGRRV